MSINSPTPYEKAALAGTNGVPSGANKFVTNSDPRLVAGGHTHTEAQVTGLLADLAAKEAMANKGQPNGYASLDGNGLVPAAMLPVGASGPPTGDYGSVTVPAAQSYDWGVIT